MKTAFALLCISVAALGAAVPGAAGAGKGEGREPLLEYLARPELRPIYLLELRRLALEEGSLQALRDYAGMLLDEGRIGLASAFADSIEVDGSHLDALVMLIRAEGLLRGRDYERALAALDSLTSSFPVKPALIEAQYLRARCLFDLGRFEEARLHLEAIRDEGEGLRAGITFYLALCNEETGDIDEALDGFEVLHNAAFARGTAGLIRCHLRRGDVERATAVYREAAEREIELPLDERLGLLEVTAWGAPGLWKELLASVAADTTFSPDPLFENMVLDGLERGAEVGKYCDDLLARGGSDKLRYARAMSLESEQAAYDSLVAIAAGTEPVLRGPFIMAMARLASGSEDLAMPTQTQIDLVRAGPYWDKIAYPNEIIYWLNLRAGGVRSEDVWPVVEDYARPLAVGFDDRALLELGGLLERAGDTAKAIDLYTRIQASPVPSEAVFASEERAYSLGLKPPVEEDISLAVQEVAEGEKTSLEVALVFDERLRDYARAAGYYQRAAGETGDAEERDRIRLMAARAFSNDYIKNGNGASRDKALNSAAALAASAAVDPGDLIGLLKSSTGWLTLDLFRSTEAARALAAREDLDDAELLDLARVLYRLYERGDAPAYDLCLDVLGRLFELTPAPEAIEQAVFLDACIRLRKGDYPEALERFDACRRRARDSTVKKLSRMGMGDCYVGRGDLEKALENYDKAGASPSVSLRKARCYQALGRSEEALETSSSVLGIYTADETSVAARMLTGILSAGEARLPRDVFTLYFDRYHYLGMHETYGEYIPLLAAYDLALAGYDGLALRFLETIPRAHLDGVHCQVLLSAYDPVTGDHAGLFRAMLDHLSPNCKDALDSYARMKLRAELDCASGTDEICLPAGERFKQRFPLARRAADDIDAIRANMLYRDMYVGKADAIADSLFERGVRSELLADAVYRKGISFLLEKAGEEAKQNFLIMKEYFPESRLRPDVYFKLGTTYYITEAYDSSAAHFRMAADQGNVTLRQDALFNLGLALEESGDLAGASGAFYELAAGFPFSERFERALMRSAYCLEKNGLPLEARDIYKTLLEYAAGPETRAEANFWLGECLAEAGLHGEAALEFLRTGHLYPGEEAWAGTALYRAGMECQSAGLRAAAKLIYERNVSTFGLESTWGAASYEKLTEIVGER